MKRSSTSGGIEPIRKSVIVPETPAVAFRLFTEAMHRWWPLATHSVGGEKAESCGVEGRASGRLFERQRSGKEVTWGTVRIWDPPSRLAFTWHPGRLDETAQEVEIRFLSVLEGTRLELEHRGWERLGAEAAVRRRDYDTGWDYVLDSCYRDWLTNNTWL